MTINSFIVMLLFLCGVAAHNSSYDRCYQYNNDTTIALVCVKGGFITVPADKLPHPNITSIQFANNTIKQLSSKAFPQWQNITTLVFDRNQLEHIFDGAFEDLNQLKNLSLAVNKLSTLLDGAFKGLIKLENLDLRKNNLNTISSGVLSQLPKLQNLDIYGNNVNHELYVDKRINVNNGAQNVIIGREMPASRATDLLNNEKVDTKSIGAEKPEELLRSKRGIPNYYSCKERRRYFAFILDCSKKAFSEIPDQSPVKRNQYTELRLDQNAITVIPKRIFYPFTNLLRLNLSENRIEHIGQDAFLNLKKLWDLDLTANNIKSVSYHAFQNFGSRVKVRLGRNKLKTLTEGYFGNAVNIATWKLDHNSISIIQYGAFFGRNDLNSLDLSYNNLQVLGDFIFTGLIRVQTLNLNYNNLSYISPTTFFGMNVLYFLSLSGNNLRSLNLQSHTMVILLGLDISHNKLKSLMDLERPLSLYNLNVGFNEIQNITDEDMNDFAVTAFYAKGNKLSYISRRFSAQEIDISNQRTKGKLTLYPEIMKRQFKKNVRTWIDVSNNNFRCTCDMEWLVNIIHTGQFLDGRIAPAFQRDGSKRNLSCSSHNMTDSKFAPRIFKDCSVHIKSSYRHCNSEHKFGAYWRMDCKGKKIGSVPNQPLSDTAKYHELDLSSNDITNIPAGIFETFKSLQVLKLANNEIRRIEPEAFKGLSKLEVLLLSNNRLEFISDKAFGPLHSIERIDLDGQISKGRLSFSQKMFKAFINKPKSKSYMINISRNDLRCDCDIYWLVQLLVLGYTNEGNQIPAIQNNLATRNVACNKKLISQYATYVTLFWKCEARS